MKVLCVGGAGGMGRVAAATIALEDTVEVVLIADRDVARADEVAASIGSKTEAFALDITDAAALQSAVARADMVLNTVGPFYVFGRPVLEAAIDSGVHYLDINDDWEPTVEMLELSDRAEQAGVTAVIGMGASPGITNLLAAVAYRELDQVSRLITGWRAGGGIAKPTPEDPAPEASAAVDHWIHNCSEPIRVWRDRRFVEVDPLEKFELSFPGHGTGSVWTCGHPEPVTLPVTFPDIEECINVMCSRPGLIAALQRSVAGLRTGRFETVHAASNALLLEPGRRGPAAGDPGPFPNTLWAVAEGRLDGEPTRVGVCTNVEPIGDIGAATGIPLAVAAAMLARDEITLRGVVGPEAAVDPDVFFRHLAPFGDNGAGTRDLVEITRERMV